MIDYDKTIERLKKGDTIRSFDVVEAFMGNNSWTTEEFRDELVELLETARDSVRGPLDADGEMWHSGDMSDSNWGVIEGIAYDDGQWFVSGHDMSAPWVPADSIRHYHKPTVDDVMHELEGKWNDVVDNGGDVNDTAALIIEYAEKLRELLKEDEA